jgi:predicted phosphodiesterase
MNKSVIHHITNELVIEYIDKYPSFPNRTLARHICIVEKLDKEFIENVRSLIRYTRGCSGDKLRSYNQLLDKRFPKYSFPDGITNDYTAFHINEMRIGIISDLHVPFHSQKSLKIALNHFKTKKIKTILINGDFIDCYHYSNFVKHNYEEVPLPQVVFDTAEDILEHIKNMGFSIYYKLGNHEDWYETAIRKHDNAFASLDIMSFEEVLPFRKYVKKVIKDKRVVKFGKLNILHGHEFFGKPSIELAPRWYYNKAKTNILCSHIHAPGFFPFKDINDSIKGSWVTGCMFDLHPAYSPLNNFIHGFACAYKDKDGDFEVENMRIINGKIGPA